MDERPLFYVPPGMQVIWKRQESHVDERGLVTVTDPYPICAAHASLGPQAAGVICELMNAGDIAKDVLERGLIAEIHKLVHGAQDKALAEALERLEALPWFVDWRGPGEILS